MNQIYAKTIKDTANRLKLSISEPITVSEYIRDYVNKQSNKKPNKVLVDEALFVLGQVLETNVDTVTFTEYGDCSERYN